jgi:acetyl esterase/lipase
VKKYLFIIATAFLLVFFSATAFSQDSNLKEDYTAFVPEVIFFNKMLLQNQQPVTLLTKEGLEKERNLMKTFAPAKTILLPTQKNITGTGGNIRLVIFKPDTIRAVVLQIHGGAWIVGTPENDAALNDEMARICKVAVVSIDYRLAPEFPFPACIEDCKAVARWLVKNAKTEFGTDKLFISGASAGGHLSAVTALYIRDSLHAIDKVKGLNLLYGCFDLGRTPSNRQVSDSAVMLNKKSIEESMQVVFGGWTMEKLQRPEFSPLYADLKGLPPALFTVGTADPLLDDTYFMEDRWSNAGNKTFLAVYPASPHLFNIFPTKMAKAANERMFNWIIELCK